MTCVACRMVLLLVVLDKTIEINAPPSAVFQVLTRIAQAPAWVPGTVRATRDGGGLHPSGPLEVGSGVLTVVDAAGMRLQSAQVLTDLQPDAVFGWRQREGDFARHQGTYRLLPTPHGTTVVRLRMEVELPFVLPVMITEAEVARDFSGRMDHALMNLKDLIECRAS